MMMAITKMTFVGAALILVSLTSAQAQLSQNYGVCTGILQAGDRQGNNAVAELGPGDWVIRAGGYGGLNCIVTSQTNNRRIISACRHGQRCEVRGILGQISIDLLVGFKRLFVVKPLVASAAAEPQSRLSPSAIIGEWCFVQQSNRDVTIYERLAPQVRGCKRGVAVDPSGYDWNQSTHCTFAKVEQLARNAYRTSAHCEGVEGAADRDEASLFQIVEELGGRLMIYNLNEVMR
jgi:hypothetical protein